MLHFLHALTEQYSLPDLSFVYLQQDCLPRFGLKTRALSLFHHPIPIFVSAKTDHQRNQVLFCDWHYDPVCHSPVSWNGMVAALADASSITSWNSKINKLVWRGGPNDGIYTPDTISIYPRGRLVLMAECDPDRIDASFNNYPPNFMTFRNEFSQRFPTRFISPLEMARYKYQIDLDGVTATFTGLAWKLLSGSLVFKQQSANKTWFHDLLKPWVHYIPVRKDLNDLRQKLDWAQSNDNECQVIGCSARKLALSSILPKKMKEYCAEILIRYAALFLR